MFRQSATRRATLLLRSSTKPSTTTTNSITNRIVAQRRFASTEGGNAFVPNPPSQKRRSWRNRLVRLGLAGGVIYFYNTSIVFAEEPTLSLRPQPLDSEDAPTLSTLGEKVGLKSHTEPTPNSTDVQVQQQQEEGGLEGLENQAHNEGAFNPETGEINWDCPCLGGMAYGPCGQEFREAFSCFVYSQEEPKGMDCIEKFKGMQDCFRLHPEVYGSELQEDEVDEQLAEQIAQRDREEQAIKAQKEQQQPQTQRDVGLADPAVSTLNEAEKHAETTEVRKSTEAAHAASQKEEELVPRECHESDGETKTEK
ncbi:mitochondrial intermembrane space protein Mia40 [Talaromyces stipitatus ATCC 10500]|uniref:Mitochondrial intermembrane space import and assembly protein 40 n=1 Tax=Talaromyces stipitatus (strain ATCC 10500 / CBS 375.48 / QM 6759 / NRRL 1006) TaxID=441959 RepID=B8MIX4_TALSN|nr:mitochondrial intermembrane space protein Mia40 [Talaromyces stipitatus ATCC 10500]EED15636.1 mitochondrial intermembrane space protein Mia40 [Talaromyces stipitatus ATCC 10500]